MTSERIFRFLALASIAVALTVSSPATADDVNPPPWRFTAGTTYQEWDFSAGNVAASPPDSPAPGNPFNPPAIGGGFLGMRPSGNAVFQWAFGPMGGVRADVWKLGPAGMNNNPPAGRLLFDIPNYNNPLEKKVLRLQVTYFVGNIGADAFAPPQYDVFDVTGPRFCNPSRQTVVLPDGWTYELSEWDLTTCPQAENIAIDVQLGAMAAIDQVVVDTRCSDGIDGILDVDKYQVPLAIQQNPTSLGDNNIVCTAGAGGANGSELDVAYGTIKNNTLFLFLAGNLKSDGTKLHIFFDSVDGGQNILVHNNPSPPGDMNALNRMGENTVQNPNPAAPTVMGPGLQLSRGFEADYWIGVSVVPNAQQMEEISVWYARLRTPNDAGVGRFLGRGLPRSEGALVGGNNPDSILASIDNTNTAGITANATPLTGWGVRTGVELSIPLAALGNPAGRVKVSTFITNSAHDQVSSQFLDGFLPVEADLGEPRNASLCPGLTPNQRAFEVQPDTKRGNDEWFRLWTDRGTEDQRMDCVGPPLNVSYLVGAPTANPPPFPPPCNAMFLPPPCLPADVQAGHYAIKDVDFASKIARFTIADNTKLIWSFSQCFGGGLFDELSLENGVQSGASASRYSETSSYNVLLGGNRETWSSRYFAGIGNGQTPARAIAAFAARNDPWGPAKNPTDPPRTTEDPAVENPVYFTTGAAADALALNTAMGPADGGYAIFWSGHPLERQDPANPTVKLTPDLDEIVRGVQKLLDNGWNPNRIHIFYFKGVVGAGHRLKGFRQGGMAVNVGIDRASQDKLSALFIDLYPANMQLGRPKLLFFFVNDHGINPAYPGMARRGGEGGTDDPDCEDQGDMTPTFPDPGFRPPNDDSPQAIPVGEGTYSFSSTDATNDGPSACGAVGSDIWYCYTATCTGPATVSLCGSGFDTVAAVYDGCGPPAGSPLACNDDSCGAQSEVSFSAVAGHPYMIRVGGQAGAQGTGTMAISCGTCAPAGETGLLTYGPGKQTISWVAAPGATSYDVVLGSITSLPVGPGGGDELCVADNVAANSVSDDTVPPAGNGLWYVVRGNNSCGSGSYGYPSPGFTPRVTTTCP